MPVGAELDFRCFVSNDRRGANHPAVAGVDRNGCPSGVIGVISVVFGRQPLFEGGIIGVGANGGQESESGGEEEFFHSGLWSIHDLAAVHQPPVPSTSGEDANPYN
jgi:hypothetical protein